MKYAIGLDVEIESVGYSVLELDTLDQPIRIERLESRIFDKSEHSDRAMITICDDALAPMSFSTTPSDLRKSKKSNARAISFGQNACFLSIKVVICYRDIL
jgi:hypothetical protein